MTAQALPPGLAPVAGLIRSRLADAAHGDMPRWRAALDALPQLTATTTRLSDTVSVGGPVTAAQRETLRDALAGLHPWRKGPFELFGVAIDSEWRSDWKWQRVAPHLADLTGARVLDVGCGNGYFGWRMLGAGAREVLGVDPTLLFCMQHQAVRRYVQGANQVLPLRFEELPAALTVDAVFSMGVVYHRRDPLDHVRRLYRHLRPGGQLVIESLIVQGTTPLAPAGRYARMRNVHLLPTPQVLADWLVEAGFTAVRVADVCVTRIAEQRSTGWMRFESLAEALDPAEPSRTVEGHPAPCRAIVVARKPV